MYLTLKKKKLKNHRPRKLKNQDKEKIFLIKLKNLFLEFCKKKENFKYSIKK